MPNIPSFICTRCYHERSSITDVRRTNEDHRYVRRRRQCFKCGNRWTTFEIRREEFEDMEKIVTGYFRIRAMAASELNTPAEEPKADA
jgi:transcriptional regulator NrdR family protein